MTGDREDFPFTAVLGNDELQLALVLAAVDPTIGGVLALGEKGSAKSTAARSLARLLPADGAFVELPIGVTEEMLSGTIDIESAIREGEKRHIPGLPARADGGVLYVDEVNLLPDHIVDVLLDSAASGMVRVERDGISAVYSSRFVLVGTMNPEEGGLRPQLLDRFGLCVEVMSPKDPLVRAEIIRRRIQFDADPTGFKKAFDEADAALARKIASARPVPVPDEIMEKVARLCVHLSLSGMRGDITCCKAASALAGFEGRDVTLRHDVVRVAKIALSHRRKRDPLSDGYIPVEEMDAALMEIFGDHEGRQAIGGTSLVGGDNHDGYSTDAYTDGALRSEGEEVGNTHHGGPGDSGMDKGSGHAGLNESMDDGSSNDLKSIPAGQERATKGQSFRPSDASAMPHWGGNADGSVADLQGEYHGRIEDYLSREASQEQSADYAGSGMPADGLMSPSAGPDSAKVSIAYPQAGNAGDKSDDSTRMEHSTWIAGGKGERSGRGIPSAAGNGRVVRYVPVQGQSKIGQIGQVALAQSIAVAASRQASQGVQGVRGVRAAQGDATAATPTACDTAGQPALNVQRQDLRVKETRTRRPRLVVFGLDTSGSMGVHRRIEFARGAVESLLYESYRRRDRVALVSVCGSSAEIVLNPTGSLEVARSRIIELKTGGRTPLASGISKMTEVMLAADGRGYDTLGVLVSDGRSTYDSSGLDPHVSAIAAAARMKSEHLQSIVVDISSMSGSHAVIDLAEELAGAMGARLVRISDADPDALVTAISHC
ncbi:MAG: AAA family ATPase [Actinobacteria bacterium]|nr:AAA family ATPase [Actinomycetota bacterium]